MPSSLLLSDQFDEAARQAKEFEDILGKGNYYLEVQNHGLEQEVQIVIPGMIALSRKTGIPLAATNDCHYLMRDDWRAHDILVRSFGEQDVGVPVFAALDGTVADAHDGEFDRNTVLAGQPAQGGY